MTEQVAGHVYAVVAGLVAVGSISYWGYRVGTGRPIDSVVDYFGITLVVSISWPIAAVVLAILAAVVTLASPGLLAGVVAKLVRERARRRALESPPPQTQLPPPNQACPGAGPFREESR